MTHEPNVRLRGTMRRAVPVSLLGMAALAGCASGHASPSARAVPWVDRPLPLYHTPQPKPVRYPTTAPACRARQLRVATGPGGAAAGNDGETLLFRNAGSKPCLLRGYPTVSVETSSGERESLHPRHGTFFGALTPADVLPGRHVLLDFGTSSGCRGGDQPIVRYRDVVVTLPEGGSVAVPPGALWKQCGFDMSGFGLPERFTMSRARTGTAGTLQAAVDLGTELRAGSRELDYVVTLSNPTSAPVRLAPCPGYTESVYVPGLLVHRSFALDCDSVHVIRAHGHVRFAMRLGLSRALPAAPTPIKFSWSLDTATGPFVGKALVLRGT